MSENHGILKLEKDLNLLFPWFHLQMKKLKPRLEKEPTHGHTTYHQTETSSAVFAIGLWESLLQREKEGASSSSSRINRLGVTILLTIKCTGFLSNTYHQCALMARTQVHRHHCSGETDSRLSSATHKLFELGQTLVIGKHTNQKMSNEGAWTKAALFPPPALHLFSIPLEGHLCPHLTVLQVCTIEIRKQTSIVELVWAGERIYAKCPLHGLCSLNARYFYYNET